MGYFSSLVTGLRGHREAFHRGCLVWLGGGGGGSWDVEVLVSSRPTLMGQPWGAGNRETPSSGRKLFLGSPNRAESGLRSRVGLLRGLRRGWGVAFLIG